MRMTDTDVAAREAETRRAEQARAILDNPLWAEIRARLDADIKRELLVAAIDDHQKLINLKLFAQAIGEVEHDLNRIATSGKLAADQLRRHYSTLERLAERFKSRRA